MKDHPTFDTPQGLEPCGCSLQHRDYRPGSTMGLPGPQHLLGRVLVAARHPPTAGAHRGTHAHALPQACATARTLLAGLLAGVSGWHGDDPTPGAGCRGVKDAPKWSPSRLAEALRELGGRTRVDGHPHICQLERVVGPEQIGPEALSSASAVWWGTARRWRCPGCWCLATSRRAFSRRVLPVWRRARRRGAVARRFSALGEWREFAMGSPSAVTRPTGSPPARPVSVPVG